MLPGRTSQRRDGGDDVGVPGGFSRDIFVTEFLVAWMQACHGSEPLGAWGAKLLVEGSSPCFHVLMASGRASIPVPSFIYTLIPSPSFAFLVFVQIGVKMSVDFFFF